MKKKENKKSSLLKKPTYQKTYLFIFQNKQVNESYKSTGTTEDHINNSQSSVINKLQEPRKNHDHVNTTEQSQNLSDSAAIR